mgnify:CR=1 FL=1
MQLSKGVAPCVGDKVRRVANPLWMWSVGDDGESVAKIGPVGRWFDEAQIDVRRRGWRSADGGAPRLVGDGLVVVLDKLLRTVELGEDTKVSGEGTHFRIPWLQTPHIFDVRIRPRNISSATGTKDLQVVTINLRVLSQPNKEMLPQIFQQYGKG